MNRDVSTNDVSSSDVFMASVRELCHLMNIRQRDLAASLDLKPSQMNLYFQNKVEMRADRMLDLLKILGIDLNSQIRERIAELNKDESESGVTSLNSESRVLAKLGRLDEGKRQSLLRIIHILSHA